MVSVTNVSYRYPGATHNALANVSLNIAKGSCFGLLGPNGAGKTTLISLMTGVLDLQQGEISVAGQCYPQHADAIKNRSALVPQEYAFYPSLTARENMAFFAGIYGITKSHWAQRMAYCIEVCGLGEVLDQRAASYSGGVKRRLNIALGLLHEPELLYLDEPTVGIDAQSRRFILSAIEQLKQDGMTIVYTSHYMEEVEQLCDEIAIIDHGEKVVQAPLHTLLNSGGKLVVTPSEKPSQEQLQRLSEQLVMHWDGSRLVIEPGAATLSQALAQLEQAGVKVAALTMAGSRLEEIYLAYTDRALRQ
jgi:ABC-2 type transport system ATP-binding protein